MDKGIVVDERFDGRRVDWKVRTKLTGESRPTRTGTTDGRTFGLALKKLFGREHQAEPVTRLIGAVMMIAIVVPVVIVTTLGIVVWLFVVDSRLGGLRALGFAGRGRGGSACRRRFGGGTLDRGIGRIRLGIFLGRVYRWSGLCGRLGRCGRWGLVVRLIVLGRGDKWTWLLGGKSGCFGGGVDRSLRKVDLVTLDRRSGGGAARLRFLGRLAGGGRTVGFEPDIVLGTGNGVGGGGLFAGLGLIIGPGSGVVGSGDARNGQFRRQGKSVEIKLRTLVQINGAVNSGLALRSRLGKDGGRK
jgi:hypothetical protein